MTMKRANDVFLYTNCFQTAGKEKINTLNCNYVRWENNSMKGSLAGSSIKVIKNINDNVVDMESCFEFSSNLQSIDKFPSSVQNLKRCFYSCQSITTLPTIPSTVSNVESAFRGTNLSTMPTLPSIITSLQETFAYTAITGITSLPANVQNLYISFIGCGSLTSVSAHIPESVTNMDQTFDSCSALTGDIYIDSKNIISSSPATLPTFGNTTLNKDVYIYFYNDDSTDTSTYTTMKAMGYNDSTRVNGVLLINRSAPLTKLDVTNWVNAYNPTTSKEVDLVHYEGTDDCIYISSVESDENSYTEIDTDKWNYTVEENDGVKTVKLTSYKDTTDDKINVPYIINNN